MDTDFIGTDILVRSDQATIEDESKPDFSLDVCLLMAEEGEKISAFPIQLCVVEGVHRETDTHTSLSCYGVTMNVKNAERVYAALGIAIERAKKGDLRATPAPPLKPLPEDEQAKIEAMVDSHMAEERALNNARFHERHFPRRVVRVKDRLRNKEELFADKEAALLYIAQNYPRAKRVKEGRHYTAFRVRGKIVASMYVDWMYDALYKSRERGTEPLKLYWCTTPDHDEDWFVIAHSKREACRYHEQQEGYDSNYAEAELVCRVPADAEGASVGWPDMGLLRDCGGTILPDLPKSKEHRALRAIVGQGGRVVIFNGRAYREGDMVRNIINDQMPKNERDKELN